MEIYARPGHLVQYIAPFTEDYLPTKENARKYLTQGQIYTVQRTSVDRSFTTVYLVGLKDIPFRSVQFIDAIKQPDHWRRGHIDFWHRQGLIQKKRRDDLYYNSTL